MCLIISTGLQSLVIITVGSSGLTQTYHASTSPQRHKYKGDSLIGRLWLILFWTGIITSAIILRPNSKVKALAEIHHPRTIAGNHGLQRRPRVDVFEVESRSRGPAEPYRSPAHSYPTNARNINADLCRFIRRPRYMFWSGTLSLTTDSEPETAAVFCFKVPRHFQCHVRAITNAKHPTPEKASDLSCKPSRRIRSSRVGDVQRKYSNACKKLRTFDVNFCGNANHPRVADYIPKLRARHPNARKPGARCCSVLLREVDWLLNI